MTESRLVTLTGPGGVGKTRIAYELAERSRRAFRDGSWVVELASVEDESGLASIVVSSLAVADQSNRAPIRKLVEHLRERQLLIVLDNCEHLLAPVAQSGRRDARRIAGAADSGHQPGAARHRRRAHLHRSASDDSAQGRRADAGAGRPVRGGALAGRSRPRDQSRFRCDTGRTPMPWCSCATGSTASRWPSNSPPPGCAPCRSPRSWIGWTGDFRC